MRAMPRQAVVSAAVRNGPSPRVSSVNRLRSKSGCLLAHCERLGCLFAPPVATGLISPQRKDCLARRAPTGHSGSHHTRSSGTWYFGSAYGSSPAGASGSTFNATAGANTASASASTDAVTSR